MDSDVMVAFSFLFSDFALCCLVPALKRDVNELVPISTTLFFGCGGVKNDANGGGAFD